jgi:hypothetical protein
MLFTVGALARMLDRTPKAIYNLLTRRAAELSHPMYCQLGWPRDRKLYRVIPECDVRVLCARFPLYVKQNGVAHTRVAHRKGLLTPHG